MQIKVNFKFRNETKGAVRFQEVDKKGVEKTILDGAVIGSLYLRKSALNGKTPDELSVSITAQD